MIARRAVLGLRASVGASLIAGAVGGACVVGGRYACNDDARCIDGDRVGVCEPTGYCSFADPSCDSGARYSRFAPPSLADRCTEVVVTDDSSSTGTTSTGVVAGSDSSGAPGLDLGDPPVHPPPDAECGDGFVAGFEACDDGNLVQGDGCNNDCVASGTPLWTVVIDGSAGGSDIVNAVATMPDGDIVATGRSAGDGGDAWMARFDPGDGAQLRTWQYGGTMFDEGAAITADAEAQIHVVGTTTATDTGRALFVRVYYDDLYDGGVPDGNAELVWSRTLNSPMAADDSGRAVAMRPSGDQVVVAGSFGDAADPEHPDSHARGFPRTGGNAVWTSNLGIDPLADEATAVAIDASGRVFLAGFVRTATGNARTDGWVGELNLAQRDTNVPYLWVTRIGDLALREAVYALAMAPDGALLVGGHLDDHAFWAVYSTDGVELERHVAVDVETSAIRAIAADPTGAIITVGDHALPERGNDVEVIKYTPDREVLWIDQFDGDAHGNDTGRGVVVAEDGSVVAVGATWAPASDSDFWLRKYAP
jgi:cysteine-rich repeat protein